jgi:hypothetical protein
MKRAYIDTRKGRLAALTTIYHVRYDGQYDDNGGRLLLVLLPHTAGRQTEKQRRKEQNLKMNKG